MSQTELLDIWSIEFPSLLQFGLSEKFWLLETTQPESQDFQHEADALGDPPVKFTWKGYSWWYELSFDLGLFIQDFVGLAIWLSGNKPSRLFDLHIQGQTFTINFSRHGSSISMKASLGYYTHEDVRSDFEAEVTVRRAELAGFLISVMNKLQMVVVRGKTFDPHLALACQICSQILIEDADS